MATICELHVRDCPCRASSARGLTYGRGLDDGDGLNDLLLVHLGTGTVKITDGGGHASLVSEGSGQVDRLGLVILGEGLDCENSSGSSSKSSDRGFPSSPCTCPCGGWPACGARTPTNRAWELPASSVNELRWVEGFFFRGLRGSIGISGVVRISSIWAENVSIIPENFGKQFGDEDFDIRETF